MDLISSASGSPGEGNLSDAAATSARTDQIAILFQGRTEAERLIAGVPAVARLLREMVAAGFSDILIDVGESGGLPSGIMAEVHRIAPDARVRMVEPHQDLPAGILRFPGHYLALAGAITRWRQAGSEATGRDRIFQARQDDVWPLDEAAVQIIRRTGKAADGIVSRWINRPISQRLSLLLLRLPGARPHHGTLLTIVAAMLMFAAFLWGGGSGLMWGGLFFQLASILDGTDGEMARATFRSSNFGAALDSWVDMATNLLFCAGIATNLLLGGRELLGWTAAAGLGSLGAGIAMLSWLVRMRGSKGSFNLLKDDVAGQYHSGIAARIGRMLVLVTSRDFFAFLLMVMLVCSLEEVAVPAFAISTTLWMLFVLASALRLALVPRQTG